MIAKTAVIFILASILMVRDRPKAHAKLCDGYASCARRQGFRDIDIQFHEKLLPPPSELKTEARSAIAKRPKLKKCLIVIMILGTVFFTFGFVLEGLAYWLNALSDVIEAVRRFVDLL